MKHFIERLLNIRVVRPTQVALLFEQIHLQRFLSQFNVDCVFDVGANEGQYASMLRSLGYKGIIISFEPIPKSAELLRKKAQRDPLWHIEQIALDSSVRETTFNIMSGSQFSSLNEPSEKEVGRFKDANKVIEKISVQTSTLKVFYTKYESLLKFKRPFLKMDTQGNDLEVARGAEELFQNFIGLQSELSIKRIYANSVDYKETIAYYTAQGFELSAFVPNNEGHFPQLIETDCIMYNKKSISL